MRLGLLSTATKLIRDSIVPDSSKHTTVSPDISKGTSPNREEHTIILKEKKRSVQIACWNCGKLFWAMRGSKCQREGLCHTCLQNRGR